MKQKRKYLAQWVRVEKLDSAFYKKCGVVIDEEYVHNGVMCCKIIIGSEIIFVETQHLTIIQV